ncbi:PREDICTED: calmodulin-like protein 5 [Propithecus coquereli]|uniref:calmodulin-like protein 5 n=1 Tax=Propithecus coquereli TaxID=379532 RepID=UPI00063FA77E|nr:PREDICTED: calmodulin-like protein 5 [Propithecus coquereli]
MAESLSEEEVAQFKEVFKRVDKDRDGKIDAKELGEAIQAMGKKLSEEEVKKIIEKLDSNHDGTISFPEFLAELGKKVQGSGSEQDLRATFRAFDLDGDGHISVDELRQAIAQLGVQLSQEELDALVREADTNQDGQVDFEEFARVLGQK